MARIRSIKPEIWEDEKFAAADPLAQLVFIGLISNADDAGRLVDSVRRIDGLLWPYDDSRTCRESLANLSRLGLIERGTTAGGQRVIQIVGWEKHQRVDKPNLKAALPPLAPETAEPRDSGERREGVGNDSGVDPEPLAPHINDQDLRSTIDDHEQRACAREGRAEAFNELVALLPGDTGPLIPAESAYYATVPADVDHVTLARRWPAYAARQRARGLNVPHLSNFIRRQYWADETLDDYDPERNGAYWDVPLEEAV